MRIKVAIRWCVSGALVLGLGLPQFAAAGASQEPPAKSTTVKAAPGTLRPVVAMPANFGISRPLSEIAAERSAQSGPILTHKIFEVPNQQTPRDEDENVRIQSKSATHGPDGALQTTSPIEAMPTPSANFDGVSSADNAAAFGGRVYPPDTDGAVGPNHYVQAVNLLVGIYSKAGTLLVPKFKMSSLFASLGAPCGTRDDGDPIVLYDRLADRWLISQFVLPNYPSGPFYEEIAISQTGDPTGAYYIYCFMVHATEMNDYPHFGIWPDGYYMTSHQFTAAGAWAGQGVWCFNRTKMLAGDPTASFIYFDLNALDPAIGGMLPADADGLTPPPLGAPNVFAYPLATEWGDAVDGMRLFNFHADWAVPANSTFTERAESPVATAAYDPSNPSGRRDITQPPPATSTMKLDSIADRYMHRLQYRNFGSTESLILCQSVDALVWPSYQSAVRYCQLKNASLGGAFAPVEQTTFAPDGDHRWMGSAACDWQGNLAVGYSVSSLTTFPSVRYAGRLVSDPANQLTQGEATLVAGSGVQRGTANRWGDYSALSLDPTDDATFWYTQEYYTAASQATSTVGWLTRVGSFKFAGVPASPRGTLTAHVTNCVTGLPVPNAVISTSNGYFRTTDASGDAVLTMAPGTYTVTASKSSYQAPVSASGVITNGGNTVLNFCLQPTVPLLTVGPATLVTESCVPPNGVIDPNEQVTVSFCVNNMGSNATSNLIGTLQTTGGVVNPSAPAMYGVVAGDGGLGCANVTFAASYLLSCGGTLTATVHFQDGALDLGSFAYTFTLGTMATVASQNFDGVTAPALPVGWTATRPTGTVPFWASTTAQASSAPNSVFSADLATINDNRLDSAPMAIPSAPSKLTFRNYYNTESTYDGGALEISIAGGAFTDILAAGGTFASGGYNGTINSSFGNPLAGRQAWTGNAGAWILTTVNLPAAAQGQNVVFRFRLGSDNAVAATGWYVDTLTITAPSCCVCPPITIAPAALPSTVVGLAYNQQLSASGTSGPYTYAVTTGTLPPGITLSAGGLLSGLPTSKLTFTFTVTATDAAGCSGTKVYSLAASTLFFLDDAGRCRLCVNGVTGAYTFQILTGPNAGMTFTGIANIVNGGAKIYSKPGAADYLNFTYDSSRKRASGYFMSAAGVYSTLADYNTANNTGGCS